MSEKLEAMAWAVNCPARHECDFLVFHDPQEAEIQAEQWNEDYEEGEGPHTVIPLYPDLDRELLRLKLERDAARLAHESSEAVLCMTVARLGGVVEGRPTHRGNFLQRIDELTRMEARAQPRHHAAKTPSGGTQC